MTEEGKQQHHLFHHHGHQPQPTAPPAQQYGTFHGIPGYLPPSQPAIGFPQPAPPPPGAPAPLAGAGPTYYAHGYQAIPVQGYVAVVEGRPVRERRLPCCGIGMGWFLFFTGFFLAAIPWYVGAFFLLCAIVDNREVPGYVACTIAAVLSAIAVILGATKGADVW